MRDGKLRAAPRNGNRLEIRYRPPLEYDFRVAFVRRGEPKLIGQVCPVEGAGSFAWLMGVDFNKSFKLEAEGVAEHWVMDPRIRNGQLHTAVVQVRRGGVRCLFDGAEVARWQPPAATLLQLTKDHALRTPDVLGLTTNSGAEFHAVELLEVTGPGEPVPADPAAE